MTYPTCCKLVALNKTRHNYQNKKTAKQKQKTLVASSKKSSALQKTNNTAQPKTENKKTRQEDRNKNTTKPHQQQKTKQNENQTKSTTKNENQKNKTKTRAGPSVMVHNGIYQGSGCLVPRSYACTLKLCIYRRLPQIKTAKQLKNSQLTFRDLRSFHQIQFALLQSSFWGHESQHFTKHAMVR